MAKLKGLAALKAAGAVRDTTPKKVEVSWTNDAGEEHTFDVWVRPMAFGTALEMQADATPSKLATALSSLVQIEGEGGKLVPLDYETALSLHPGLGWQIVQAVNARNEPPKNSAPPTSSSASSSDQVSAAEPSQKPEPT